MTTIRTRTDLTARDVRRLERHGYEILAIGTDQQTTADQDTIVWARQDGLDSRSSEETRMPARRQISSMLRRASRPGGR